MDVVPNLAFLEKDVLLDTLLDEQLQVALLCPFDRNEQLVELVVNEPVQVLHNIWVV